MVQLLSNWTDLKKEFYLTLAVTAMAESYENLKRTQQRVGWQL